MNAEEANKRGAELSTEINTTLDAADHLLVDAGNTARAIIALALDHGSIEALSTGESVYFTVTCARACLRTMRERTEHIAKHEHENSEGG
jgi:hypothetical protein